MVKVPCTCGCGLSVAPSTKQNHLKGKGTTALRARVFAKTKSLTMVDGRQQERQNDRNQGSKKRPASNPDEGGIRKRMKASQLEPSPEPIISSIFQADIDPMNQLEASLEPEASSTVQAVPLPALSTQSDKAVARTRHAMEQRWCGRQDNNIDEDEDDGDEDNEDKDDDDEDDEDEDDEDEDDEDEDEDDEDEDEDDEDEDEDDEEEENERPGLSAWDLLGEAFEREAAALGLS
jgi:hypothetical protein